MARIDGELKKAQLENVTVEPTTVTVPGRVIFDTVEDRASYCNNAGAWVELIGQTYKVVTAKTANYELTVDDLYGDIIFTNEGATGDITFTLPDAVAGYNVHFAKIANQTMIISSTGGELIYISGESTNAETVKPDSVGDFVSIYATSASTWSTQGKGTSEYSVLSRGVIGGGTTATTVQNVMDYINFNSLGNATDFGDLSVTRRSLAGLASSTRGVFGGGRDTPLYNTMDYVTIATLGNATDFGDLTSTRSGLAGCNSSTRGIFAGGWDGATNYDVIQYITIASTGNATDFGDLVLGREDLAGFSSTTRGIFAGGIFSSVRNNIDYITIATTANANDFGDLTIARKQVSGCSSSTRGLSGGGIATVGTNVIDYVTIATTGNATDFGDLVANTYLTSACSGSGFAAFNGGDAYVDTIQKVTIASLGNATDIGNLTVGRQETGALSNANGGV